MTQYYTIPNNLIHLVKKITINSYHDGLNKLNLVHHFFISLMKTQSSIYEYSINTKIYKPFNLKKFDVTDTIKDYETLTNVRNFYLRNFDECEYYEKFQKYIISLFKETEIFYYSEYELENLEETLKNINDKIDYMNEYYEQTDISNIDENKKVDIDKDSYEDYETTYNILKYLQSLYSALM